MRIGRKHQAVVLLCSVAFAALSLPADAKTAHRVRHHSVRATIGAQTTRGADGQPYPLAGVQAAEPVAGKSARHARVAHTNDAFGGFSTNSLVSEARKYVGTNPTGRGSLWCGAFMDLVLKRTGHAGGGNLASNYAHYGTRVPGPEVGAIAVMGRHGGGHVGVVTGVDASGDPIILSGNHNHTVAEAVYPRGRIYAYVMPNG
jgi:uncharacterized protein (TIGR02594 family)